MFLDGAGTTFVTPADFVAVEPEPTAVVALVELVPAVDVAVVDELSPVVVVVVVVPVVVVAVVVAVDDVFVVDAVDEDGTAVDDSAPLPPPDEHATNAPAAATATAATETHRAPFRDDKRTPIITTTPS